MTGPLSVLRDRLTNQTAVGVIGLGYVGLPQALAFADAGFQVLGFDIDTAKTEMLARGQSYLADIPSEHIARLVQGGCSGRRWASPGSERPFGGAVQGLSGTL